MNGYITVVTRTDDESYRANVVDVPECSYEGRSVADALAGATASLRRLSEDGTSMPDPRPSLHLVAEVTRHDAVAGACLRTARSAA